MQIDIKISRRMDARAGEGGNERRLIRMPRDFRDLYEFELGDFVYLRTLDGDIISLAVEPALEGDATDDSTCAYLTTEVYNVVMQGGGLSVDVELVDGITLGCDPELFLVHSSEGIVSASRIFRKWDAIGYDGLMLELRPLPSTEDIVVVANLHRMLQQARYTIDTAKRVDGANTRLVACSALNNLTAGFHLHYGLPAALLGMKKKLIAAQLVKVLDYYVGVPGIIPEGNRDAYRRTVPYMEYGKPGNYRIDNRTLEYRVPGGALMAAPLLAQGIIALGAVVMEDATSRVRAVTANFTELDMVSDDSHIREIYPNIPPMMEIFRLICNPDIGPAFSHLKNIRSDVEKMVGYPRRRKVVDAFFNALESGTAFSMEVEANWRLTRHGQRQPGQMAVH